MAGKKEIALPDIDDGAEAAMGAPLIVSRTTDFTINTTNENTVFEIPDSVVSSITATINGLPQIFAIDASQAFGHVNLSTTAHTIQNTSAEAYSRVLAGTMIVFQRSAVDATVLKAFGTGGTTGSVTPLVFENSSIDQVGETSFRVRNQINKPGTIYFVVVPVGDAKPSFLQIKTGKRANNQNAIYFSNPMSTAGGVLENKTATGLNSGVTYDVYSAAEAGGEQITSAKVTETTNAPTTGDIAPGTFTHAVGTTLNGYNLNAGMFSNILVGVQYTNGTSFTGCSIGGVSGVQIVNVDDGRNNINRHYQTWQLRKADMPANGSINISVSGGSGQTEVVIWAVVIENCEQQYFVPLTGSGDRQNANIIFDEAGTSAIFNTVDFGVVSSDYIALSIASTTNASGTWIHEFQTAELYEQEVGNTHHTASYLLSSNSQARVRERYTTEGRLSQLGILVREI